MRPVLKRYNIDPYPCKLFIAINVDSDTILSKFDMCKDNSPYEVTDHVVTAKEFEDRINTSYAFTVAVKEKSTKDVGVLIYTNTHVTTKTIAHESVHAADYVFDLVSAYTQSFSEGNEPYAYLVGYIADRFYRTLLLSTNEHAKRNKTRSR